MDVAIMGFVAPAILADWHVTKPAFGLVMGAAHADAPRGYACNGCAGTRNRFIALRRDSAED
jgi:AAHS family 4-hydroxybenzoate transporter-like MFS transporter